MEVGGHGSKATGALPDLQLVARRSIGPVWQTPAMDDFYSDTKTKPTRAMREAALDCEVGDEQKGEDPTTIELCERVAELLGKDGAVFLPSGTMCNEVAINVHTAPGDEVICARTSHILHFETGGPAALSGVMMQPLDADNGIFSGEDVAAATRSDSRYAPASSLVCVEQTSNLGGGAVWPVATLDSVAAQARTSGLATHMDGARLMNAAVASGVPAAEHAAGYDSVWIDFTKGLGAPIGAVLAGSQDFIVDAWRVKQRMGGAMRQSGIVAAMCHHALDHHVDRLADDHALASDIGARLAGMQRVAAVKPVETNIVIFDLAPDAPTAADVAAALAEHDIQVGAFGERRMRVVTHLDVDADAGRRLVDRLADHLD